MKSEGTMKNWEELIIICWGTGSKEISESLESRSSNRKISCALPKVHNVMRGARILMAVWPKLIRLSKKLNKIRKESTV